MRKNQPQMRGGGLFIPKPETSNNDSAPKPQEQSSQNRPQSLQERPKTVVRSGGNMELDPNNDKLPYNLRRMNLRFSPEMTSYDVRYCHDEYKKMPSHHVHNLEDVQSHGFSLEGLLSLSKVVTPISLFLHNHISSYDAIALAFTGSDQLKRMFGENLRLAEGLKSDLKAIEGLKGTPGAKANCRAAIREMQPKIQEFCDSINKTASVIHSKKLERCSKILSSRQRTAELVRKGVLIESLNDFKFLRNGATCTRSVGYVGMAFCAYNNYSTAINNISNGADQTKEMFIANAKTTGTIVGATWPVKNRGKIFNFFLDSFSCIFVFFVYIPIAYINLSVF